MNREAVKHRLTPEYVFPVNNDDIVIRLKTGKDVEEVKICYGDPWDPEGFKTKVMEKSYPVADGRIFETTVTPPYKRLCYEFIFEEDGEKLYYLEEGFMSEKKHDSIYRRLQRFFFPWLNPVDVITTPEWTADTVWYQIFPDRFFKDNDKPGFEKWDAKPQGLYDMFGGTLSGISKKLDYLKELGVTGIYLNPINESTTNHRYDTVDYEKIDPILGNEQDMKELVDRAHEAGMKVMIDGVFNHSSDKWAPWQDVLEKRKASKYYDWFMIEDEDFDVKEGPRKGQYYTFGFESYMPKLNTGNPELQDYLIGVMKHWVTDWGVDGIRFDVGNEVSHDFLKKTHRELKAIDPELYLVGELWHDSLPWLEGDEYDAVMNYPLMNAVCDFLKLEDESGNALVEELNRLRLLYPDQVNRTNFNLLDSHDTDRIRYRMETMDKTKQALAMLMSLPGSISLYYGTELYMDGGPDPDCRRCMEWQKADTPEGREMFEFMRKLISLRKLLNSDDYELSHDGRLIGIHRPDADVWINAESSKKPIAAAGEVLLAANYDGIQLAPGGILICAK